MPDTLKYPQASLNEIKEMFEVVRERSNRAMVGWPREKIPHLSDGIMRMYEILKKMGGMDDSHEKRVLEKRVRDNLKNYHAEKYKALSQYLKNDSWPHWQFEFEEWIESYRRSGIVETPSTKSCEAGLWKWCNLPVHPLAQTLMDAEKRIKVNMVFLRLCHPLATLYWFFKFVLPRTFQKANT